MKKVCLALISICILAFPFAMAQEEAIPELLEPVGVKMDSEPVRRGAISQILYYEGAVITETYEAYFTVDGLIKDVNVRIGQSVKKGDVLITLDEEELQERAQLLQERIEYQRGQDEYALGLMQIDIDLLGIDWMRMIDENADGQQIRLLEEDIRARETELRQLREAQLLAIEKLEDELKAIESKLGYDEIVSPCDGRVAYLRGLDKGDFVSAFDTLICVTDDENLLIDTELISDSMIAQSNRRYVMIGGGKYDVEMLETDWQENVVISLEGGELRSKFRVLNPDGRVQAGLYACVCLETKYVEDTLIIPKNALNSDVTGRFVYMDQDGARVRQNVKIGVSTDIEVEIVEGLEEGDVVYVKD